MEISFKCMGVVGSATLFNVVSVQSIDFLCSCSLESISCNVEMYFVPIVFFFPGI